ncbi:MAG: PLP-dependent aminotransferase family protein [Candidatus Aminicenantes bacterium]|nr:PLP-dependent aminotransferase family protein [Candidatus Aminicenantes bacterium]
MQRVTLSQRAARLVPTMPALEPPDVISFGSGHGCPEVFPDLTEVAKTALNEYRAETLQYGPTLGLLEMRQWIARFVMENGARDISPDNVLVVNGAKNGLGLICRLLLDEGDSVVVTAPTYFTCIPIFKTFGVNFYEISQDAEGIVVSELEDTLAGIKNEGKPLPKLIYNVPDYHNPSGVTMSLKRREELVRTAERYGIYVIEDSPYRKVRFEGEQYPIVKAFDRTESVLVLGTVSKLVAPGMRIGWIVASEDLIARLAQLKSDLGTCPLTQRIVLEFVTNGDRYAKHTKNVQNIYRTHRDSMVASLRRELPEIRFTVPHGGYYLWLTLPEHINADELTSRALQEKVGIIPGSKFYAGRGPKGLGAPTNNVRLCYSHAEPEEIEEGIKRLAKAVNSM